MTTRRIALGISALAIIVAFGVVVFAAPTQASAENDYDSQHCFAADLNGDGVIDVVDMQRIASYFSVSIGNPRYDVRLDFRPWLAPDGEIDIDEVQFVFGRFGLRCSTYTPAKEYWMWLGGLYSYGAGCANGDEIDPVTTVFRYASNAAQIHNVLSDIGLLVDVGSEQNFRDNGGCATGEISVADDDGWTPCFPQVVCASSRWHVRANVVSTADPAGGFWAAATPHRDTGDGSPADGCTHVVLPYQQIDGFSGSGFDVAKDWVWWQMVHERGFFFEGAQWWDNRLPMLQCNDTLSASNGWVNVIWINRPF
jgi:hypothetical protein